MTTNMTTNFEILDKIEVMERRRESKKTATKTTTEKGLPMRLIGDLAKKLANNT